MNMCFFFCLSEVIHDWEERIFYFRQYFEEEEQQFGVDETRRSGEPVSPSKQYDNDDIENFLKGNTGESSTSWRNKSHQ